MRALPFAALSAWLLLGLVAHADDLPRAKPQDAGVSAEKLAQVKAAVHVKRRPLPGELLLTSAGDSRPANELICTAPPRQLRSVDSPSSRGRSRPDIGVESA